MARQTLRRKIGLLKKTIKNMKAKQVGKNIIFTPAQLIRLKNKIAKTFKLNVRKTKSLEIQRQLKQAFPSKTLRYKIRSK